MADKEFTYSDVSEHNTKKDLYMVVHDKVYNATSFVDEHPYVAPFLRRTIQLGFFRVVIANNPASTLAVASLSQWSTTRADNWLQRW